MLNSFAGLTGTCNNNFVELYVLEWVEGGYVDFSVTLDNQV